MSQYDRTLIDLIESTARNFKALPLNLGAFPGSGGGSGAPPGGYIGWLPQTRVAYDITEPAYLGIVSAPSGTLYDNLAHIRYRLNILESGGSIIVTDDNNTLSYEDTTNIHFVGSGVIVTDLGNGEVSVSISATGSGGITVVDDNTATTLSSIETVHFSGSAVTVSNLGGGSTKITVVQSSGIDETAADALYLRLDTVNNPLTDTLQIINDNNGNSATYFQTAGDAYGIDMEQYTVNDNITSPNYFGYQESSGTGDFTGVFIEGWRAHNGTGNTTGNWIHFEEDGNSLFDVDKDGNAYTQNQLLITDAPSDGTTYGRRNGAWVVAASGAALTTKTANYTILSTDDIILCNNTSGIILTLPPATGTGTIFNIKSINVGTIVVSGYLTQTIDGYNTKIIDTIYDNLTVVDGGTGTWYIL